MIISIDIAIPDHMKFWSKEDIEDHIFTEIFNRLQVTHREMAMEALVRMSEGQEFAQISVDQHNSWANAIRDGDYKVTIEND